MTEQSEARTPNAVDLHVGGRIRLRRKLLGVSQEQLADDLALTFQQVQKYERGANRVSASKLYQIAKSLQVTVAWFFDGLEEIEAREVPIEASAAAWLNSAEAIDMAKAMASLEPTVRRHMLGAAQAFGSITKLLDGPLSLDGSITVRGDLMVGEPVHAH